VVCVRSLEALSPAARSLVDHFCAGASPGPP
jgi:hypothetical protein